MNLTKKATALALSLTMMASLTTAMAAPGVSDNRPGTPPTQAEIDANGHTTISILEAKKDNTNVSFEVPLYVTMAVVDSKANAIVPSPNVYKITNTSADATIPIGVTRVNFEHLGGTWNTVANQAAVGSEAKNLHLSINGVSMPALTTAGSAFATLTGSAFMKDTTHYKAIENKKSMELPIVGDVFSTTRNDVGAAAQFKVKYTISALDAAGLPVGAAYVGDDRTLAGLGAFTPNP